MVNPDAEAKAAVYDLYRYLNAIHALLYQSVVPHLPQKPSEMIQLGLLTKGEAEILGQAANKQRDLLLTWAGQRVEALRQSGHIDGGVLALSFSLLKLRAMCARHHDLFLRHMPNIWFAASRLLVDLLIALLLIQLPLNAVDVAALPKRLDALSGPREQQVALLVRRLPEDLGLTLCEQPELDHLARLLRQVRHHALVEELSLIHI